MIGMNIRCNNRSAYLDNLEVQDGWTDDGRRRMITIPNRMTKSCQFDQKDTEPGCQGCRWQRTGDPRDAVVS